MLRWNRCAALAALVCTLPARAQTNVLLLLADDLGVDRVGAYAAVPDPGHTPVIDSLAAQGVLFRHAWATPLCSPTRASILTGQYPSRQGVGEPILATSDTHELWPGEVTLPRLLEPVVACELVGKWHLGLNQPTTLAGLGPPLQHPLACGFRSWIGTFVILQAQVIGDGYYDWTEVVDGVQVQSTVYNTTAIVDEALQVVASTPEPWFLDVSFNAPHTPFHKPPPQLHTFDLPPAVADDMPLHQKAAVEAMDTEIGRLLSSMDPQVLAHTLIIFAGDNGTDQHATTPPFLPEHAKGTVYEGGLGVPLIVAGPGVVAGAECEALVSLTDLFATIADVFGVAHPTGIDSVSMLPYFSDPAQPSLRSTMFSEWFDPLGFAPWSERHRAARNEQFKLMRHEVHQNLTEEMYDLQADPFEQRDLLLAPLSPEAAAAYAGLAAAIALPPEPWNMAGLGVAGTVGEPRLLGEGDLLGGTPFLLTVQDARPSAAGILLVGLDWKGTPVAGGVIGPSIAFVIPGLVTDPQGAMQLSGSWPKGVPPGEQFVLQLWLQDDVAVHGFAATNNLVVTTPE